MATFRKRGNRWHVQIRRKDHPFLTRSFDRRIDADHWVRRTERQIDVGELLVCDPTILKQTKLRDILSRYAETISRTKRGCEPEQYRLNAISQNWIGETTLDKLTP